MKIKLTPELSYIIGFWRKRRCYDGLGIKGEPKYLELFSKEAIDNGLTTKEKILGDEDKIYFYHSAYRKFFQEIEKEQLERFKYMNEYAANYLAGTFDSAGEIDEKGRVFIRGGRRDDEVLLLRLGFVTKKTDGKLLIERPKAFLAFIKNYVKLFKDHKVFEYVKT